MRSNGESAAGTPTSARAEHFDAVVVGSGFGGAVMAHRLADAGRQVCVLERGRRYPPGSFARSPLEMRANFWEPSKGRLGLFEVCKLRHLDAVVAAGLGGGSLIYANVLLRKDERWFEGWPVTRSDLDPHYDRVARMLAPQRFPIDQHPYDTVAKTKAFAEAASRAGLEWSLPPLGVTFGDPPDRPVPGEPIRSPSGSTTDNLHGRTRVTCRLCAECDIGCNHGSKNSLDFNYLTEAARQGAVLRDCCEVQGFRPLPGGGYAITYLDHGAVPDGRRRQPSALVTADLLVLAAGTLGTTHLLLRNRRHLPGLSPRVGHRFSANGDFLGFAHGADRVLAPSHGPVITSTVRVPDRRDGGDGPGLYLQEGGYPVLVDWLVELSGVRGAARRVASLLERRMARRLIGHRHPNMGSQLASLLGGARRSAGLLPLLGMGLDPETGVLTLRRGKLDSTWDRARSPAFAERVTDTMVGVADGMQAAFSVSPLARLGRDVTVHPLGGCPMGSSPATGVVDAWGRVYGQSGLVVADGSVMPGPVGPNPSLTIAALADRFADHLL